MKFNTIDEAIEILQAMKEGKIIQFYIPNSGKWLKKSNLFPEFNSTTYRIKPEPKVIWVNEYNTEYTVYDSKEEAEECACNPVRKTIKYQEVIDEN